MFKHLLSEIGPQKNVISLEKGKEFTANWHKFINTLYQGHSKHMPHAIFVPFTDILELAKLQKSVTHIEKKHGHDPERIYIVGIRAYYCLKYQVTIPFPVSAADYPIEAVLVAVYQTNYREPGSPDEYDYNSAYPTYDLVLPVPSVRDSSSPGDAGDYSIYDITQPCPILCDTDSPLY